VPKCLKTLWHQPKCLKTLWHQCRTVLRHFGTCAKVSWCRSVLGLKCLDTEEAQTVPLPIQFIPYINNSFTEEYVASVQFEICFSSTSRNDLWSDLVMIVQKKCSNELKIIHASFYKLQSNRLWYVCLLVSINPVSLTVPHKKIGLETEGWSPHTILAQNRGGWPAANESRTSDGETTHPGQIGMAATCGNSYVFDKLLKKKWP